MKFAYHLRGERPRQKQLCTALQAGAAKHGDEVIPIVGYLGPEPSVDGVILLGVSGLHHRISNRMVYDAYLAKGKRTMLFDKGYVRKDSSDRDYLRVCVDGFQPLSYFMNTTRPNDRFEQLGIKLRPYATKGDYFLLDGVSQKYCAWHGIDSHLAWGLSVIEKIRAHSNRPIVYRLKKSVANYKALRDMLRTTISKRDLADDMKRAMIVISHGGNLGWDAMMNGRAHFAIGPSIARSVSETDWAKIHTPYVPSEAERYQLMCNAAYCQWTVAELASGEGWAVIKQQLEETK